MEAPNQQPPPQLIKAGSYPAKVKDWAVSKAKNGNPQVVISFGIVEDGAQKNVSWYGGITTEKQAKFTADVLALLGMTSNDPSLLAEGRKGGALNTEKEFEITIAHRLYEGKMLYFVEWVNDPDERKIKNAMGVAEAKGALAGFQGFLVEARQRRGAPAQKQIINHAPGANNEPAFSDSDEIPF